MVARITGTILHAVGILHTDKVIEVQRTDLVGKYIGSTGPKTKKKLPYTNAYILPVKTLLNLNDRLKKQTGAFFVDEAYRLMMKDRPWDFGLEALEEIMSCMLDGNVSDIFAGYAEPMSV
ncbi:hypothetical protein QJS04_geneDACA019359 [Acorus gramineus]|uniref:Uncharacterized protein n=1 Tax=Acorus gramineus TaxID=55184 RepID=A0AAV9ASI6_ACOGR|nr:hypothetical protein QJS04_geneDACA019359 [Acorus gramineus]